MDESPYYNEIRKHVDSVRIVDTHEHLPQEHERLKQKVDVLATFFPHYASSDLRSAGMSEEDLLKIRDPNVPLEERWGVFEPWWERIRNTGYARAVEIAARDLYGVDNINSDTYGVLSEKIKQRNEKGLYRWVLKERSGIDVSINDTIVYDVDKELFAPVRRFSEFLLVKDRTDLENLRKQVGGPIHTFGKMVSALRSEFDKMAGKIVGVKIGLAYSRPIRFEKVPFSEAEEAFNEIYRTKRFKVHDTPEVWKMVPDPVGVDLRPMQDYLVHTMIGEAERRRLPVQIHTGLQEGNENILSNSNPELLVNLFMEYKDALFDIFHGSWPYCGELGALAKNFPNVYVDMCWMHIISPSRSRTALSDWLDEVPANKILGFGGDYLFVEGAYGHSVIARENIAKVLASKVDDGVYTIEQAKKYASWLLRENAARLFFPEGL
ncbi:MAG: amidohydrolase [Aigarchaeota archaeon]|nr:amidohydrolase [Aigarchaeota archaeon]